MGAFGGGGGMCAFAMAAHDACGGRIASSDGWPSLHCRDYDTSDYDSSTAPPRLPWRQGAERAARRHQADDQAERSVELAQAMAQARVPPADEHGATRGTGSSAGPSE